MRSRKKPQPSTRKPITRVLQVEQLERVETPNLLLLPLGLGLGAEALQVPDDISSTPPSEI